MICLSPFALAAALLATSVTVLEVTPTQAATRHISYGDLDLASAGGRAVLETRLRKAAGAVCRADYDGLSQVFACRRATMIKAHADLDQAMRGNIAALAAR